jgi:tetratricopeptide (TPR) repeat protein
MILFAVFLVPLIGLAILSLNLAFSGNLAGRSHIGWIVLLVSIVLTEVIIGAFMSAAPDIPTRFLIGCFGVALFGCQAPLVITLIAQLSSPNRSKGLNLLEAHSKAERLVTEEDFPGAIGEYRRIVDAKPEDLSSLSRLADLLYDSGEIRKAAGIYGELLKHADELGMASHCSVLTKLAELYSGLDDVEKARAYAEAIIRSYPGSKYAGYARDRINNM